MFGLKDLNMAGGCPKCNADAESISVHHNGPIEQDPGWYARKYNPPGKWPEGEYMHRTCRRCGYDWPEAVLTADDINK